MSGLPVPLDDPPQHLPPDVAAIWLEYRSSTTRDGPEYEAYCGQVARLRDAQSRLSLEGLIVADAKGTPIPHPALVIERNAQAELRAWGTRFQSIGRRAQ